jgi:hypothetical protein
MKGADVSVNGGCESPRDTNAVTSRSVSEVLEAPKHTVQAPACDPCWRRWLMRRPPPPRDLPVAGKSQDSLTFQRARCVPCALTGQEDVQQVVLKIYIARESLVVLAEKESIGEREEKSVVTGRDGIERLAGE